MGAVLQCLFRESAIMRRGSGRIVLAANRRRC